MLKKITAKQDEKFEAVLKKITAKQDEQFEAAVRGQLATDVIEVYRARMAGQPATHSNPAVREVAFGLVALKQAIEPTLQKYRNNREELVATGVSAADEIIKALTTTGRRNHPLWKHIRALQTSEHTAAHGKQQLREMFAGVAIAYREATGGRRSAARIAVCEAIKAKDFPVNPGQLRKWVERYDEAAKPHAERFLADAKAIGAPAAALPQCVIIVGRKAMFPLLVIPS